MSKPFLYSFRRCPYAIRARLALTISQTDFEHREILLKDKPKSMLRYSPKGTVPVLVLTDGEQETVIDESRDIMMWALELNDPEGWLSDKTDTTKCLIDRNDREFKPILDRYKYHVRFPEKSKQGYLDEAEPILRDLNKRLSEHAYLLGEVRSLADAAIFPFIRQFYFAGQKDFEALGLDPLYHWLENWLRSELFQAVMVKRPLFVE